MRHWFSVTRGPLTATLLERDRELEELAAGIRGAAGGHGEVVIVEGPPGIGKTSLLTAARDTASAAGLRVLRACGVELEQDFPFAVVRQLLEPLIVAAADAERERWLSGAARHAAPIVDPRAP